MLDNVAGIHHKNSLRIAGDNPQIVGNEDQRGIQFFCDIPYQFQQLGLDGNIDDRSGFVRNNKLRLAGDGNGNHCPLPHAAAELMRKVIDTAFRVWDAYHFQQSCGFLIPSWIDIFL